MHKREGGRPATAYAWLILALGIIGAGAVFGMRASFGAYISAWELEFSAGRAAVTSISTLSFVVYAFGQPVAGRLNDLFGRGLVPSVSLFLVGASLMLSSRATEIWQMLLLYGVMFSIGFAGCSNAVFSAIATRWFEKKRGLALGLASAGMAAGQLVLVPVNQFVITGLGWRYSMAIPGLVIVLLCPVFLLLMRSRPEEKGMLPYGHQGPAAAAVLDSASVPERESAAPLRSLLRHKILWMLSISFFICGFTDVGLIQTHLFPMAEGRGFSSNTVVLAFSLMAAANIAGTVLVGHLTDRVSRRRQLAVIYLIRAASYVFLILLRSEQLLIPFALVFGAVDMASGPPTTSLLADGLKGRSVGTALGIVSLCHHLGGAFGSWLPGLAFDLTGSYMSMLVLAAVLLAAGAMVSLRVAEED